MTWFYASMTAVVIAMVCAAAIRFNGRRDKTADEIKKAKRLSWIIYGVAFAAFILIMIIAVSQ